MCAWGTTPPVKYTRHSKMAEKVRSNAGRWVMVTSYFNRDTARKFVKGIQDGTNQHYLPADAYEAHYKTGEADYQVWVRKV